MSLCYNSLRLKSRALTLADKTYTPRIWIVSTQLPPTMLSRCLRWKPHKHLSPLLMMSCKFPRHLLVFLPELLSHIPGASLFFIPPSRPAPGGPAPSPRPRAPHGRLTGPARLPGRPAGRPTATPPRPTPTARPRRRLAAAPSPPGVGRRPLWATPTSGRECHTQQEREAEEPF